MTIETVWTESAARHELTARPLTFGDEKQIAAHKFLEQLELARESYESCREYHSDTVVHGETAVAVLDEGCACIAIYKSEVIRALRAVKNVRVR